MSEELTRAYARIKRQWPGLAIRQHQPRIKGWPDFILIGGRVIFAEVKWLSKNTQVPCLAPMQSHWLNLLHKNGAHAFLLGCWVNGWIAWSAPFERVVFNVGVFPSTDPWWVGKSLVNLSDQLSREDRNDEPLPLLAGTQRRSSLVGNAQSDARSR